MAHFSAKEALTHIISVVLLIIIIRIVGRIFISVLFDIQWESFVKYIVQIYSSAFPLFLVCGIICGFLSGFARVYNLKDDVFFRDYIVIAFLGFLGSAIGDIIFLTLDYSKSYIQILPGDLPIIFIQLYQSIIYFASFFFIGSIICSVLLKYPNWRILKE